MGTFSLVEGGPPRAAGSDRTLFWSLASLEWGRLTGSPQVEYRMLRRASSARTFGQTQAELSWIRVGSWAGRQVPGTPLSSQRYFPCESRSHLRPPLLLLSASV